MNNLCEITILLAASQLIYIIFHTKVVPFNSCEHFWRYNLLFFWFKHSMKCVGKIVRNCKETTISFFFAANARDKMLNAFI